MLLQNLHNFVFPIRAGLYSYTHLHGTGCHGDPGRKLTKQVTDLKPVNFQSNNKKDCLLTRLSDDYEFLVYHQSWGKLATVKRLKCWRFERQPFVIRSYEGLTLDQHSNLSTVANLSIKLTFASTPHWRSTTVNLPTPPPTRLIITLYWVHHKHSSRNKKSELLLTNQRPFPMVYTLIDHKMTP